MKKIFILLLVLFTGTLWAQTQTSPLSDFYFIEGGDWYLKGGEKIGVHENMGFDLYAVYDADNGNKVNNMSLFLDEFGYVTLMYNNGSSFHTILGKNICYYDDESTDYVLNNYIKSISSEDFLTETIGGQKVEYKAENLLKSAIWGALENPYIYDTSNTPFVPKNNGKNGIGTKLTINLKKSQKKILILGGYVDPTHHPDYYYKNCRPKTIKIKDLDSDYSKTFELKDLPVYQQFDFEKPLTNIEIEVIDVYKGSKYSDLCISGILF